MIGRAAIAAVGFGLVLATGCQTSFPDPVIVTIDPNRGWNGEEHDVELRGLNFYPLVGIDARTGDVDTDAEFTVQLVGPIDSESSAVYEMSDVIWRNYTLLDMVVPSGLPLGQYDVIVSGPSGKTGNLPDAWTVSATKADHLDITTASIEYEVTDTALLEIRLLDPDDEPVLEAFDVVIEVTDEDGSVDLTFDTGGLVSPNLEGPNTISGGLGRDGFAQVGLTVFEPTTVDVRVRPKNQFPPDNTVDGDDRSLLFTTGAVSDVQITLPGGANPYDTVAGQTFDVELQLIDENGLEVNDANEFLFLRNTCGPTWSRTLSITGSATISVELSQATGTSACPTDRIVTAIGPPGESAAIRVEPGDITAFDVLAPLPAVSAGEVGAVKALVTPVDDYGNTTAWKGTTLELFDSVGGLQTTPTDCPISGGAPFFCSTTATIAGTDITLIVEDDTGIVGESNGYAVLPADADAIAVEAQVTTAAAGDPFQVAVEVTDAFGNVLLAEDLPSSVFEFSSPLEVPVCSVNDAPPDERVWFDCTMVVAAADVAVDVTLTASALTGSTDPIDVVNGELAVVSVAHGGSVVAGEPTVIDFAGFDAYGNPYVVQTDPTLSLADTGGTLSVGSVVLDAAGEASEVASFTLAGDTELVVTQSASLLGVSAPLTVLPAAPVAFEVGAPPWAWVGAPETVSVHAVDTFGNVADVDGLLSVSSNSGLVVGEPITLSMADGVASTPVEWTGTVLNDTLTADDGTFLGTSGAIAVVSDCGVAGPTIDLSFGGFSEGIACYSAAAGEATILGLLDGSLAASGHTLDLFALSVDGVDSSRDTSGSDLRVFVDEVGRYDVRGLVVQDDSCAAETSGPAWVGPEDGSPVGPISMSAIESSIDIGVQSTAVEITGAIDCSRDAAAGGTVYVRSDRGTVLGSATASGQGLVVTLDSTGGGQFVLDAVGVASGGTTTLTAWLDHPAGGGSATVELLGDDLQPVVWEQNPAGDTTGNVGVIELWFSEALLPGSIAPVNFSVTGPSAVQVVAADLVEPDRVELTLDGPVTSEAGVWSVTATDNVRDQLGGNKLDGARTGVAGDYVGTFGDLASSVGAVTQCTSDKPLFRPDGDDGLAEHADTVRFDLEAAATPSIWVVSVEDSTGTVVRRDFRAAVDSVDSWTWDGRNVGEQVVDNGEWTVRFQAGDGLGNLGTECVTTVTIDNGEAPE